MKIKRKFGKTNKKSKYYNDDKINYIFYFTFNANITTLINE